MTQFAEDSAVQRIADNHFRGELVRGWRIGAVPNGGYVMAIAGRALREVLPHADPLSVNAFYLAPTQLGPIECYVQILREGRGTSFGTVQMLQEGELKVQLTAAYTNLDALQGESWSSVQRPQIARWEDCPITASKLEYRQRVELRLAEGGEVFSERRTDNTGVFSGWVRLCDGTEPDPISLLMFADAFPPPLFSVYGPAGWVPTVELTVQVRAHPVPGPLQVRLASKQLTEGVVEEDGEYWDSSGQLVALSRQTAKFRLAKKK